MRPVLERLRPRLRTFPDERGRELFDLPDAPRPDPGTDAPVRVLPEYDNLLLSHADRSRFGSDERRRSTGAVGPFKGTVLVDGEVRAILHPELDTATQRATVVVEHHPSSPEEASAVEAEALAAARFWHPAAADHDVRLVALG